MSALPPKAFSKRSAISGVTGAATLHHFAKVLARDLHRFRRSATLKLSSSRFALAGAPG
jgi:hypothetical protein